jgi:phospholipase C
VPTVLVSPYIEAGTVFRATDWMTGREIPLDHTSILKTVTNRFGFPSLTRRDRAAADISQALTLNEPRTDYPLITSLPYHSNYAAGQPLTDLKKGIIELVAAWLSIEIPVLASEEEAVAFMEGVSRILD